MKSSGHSTLAALAVFLVVACVAPNRAGAATNIWFAPGGTGDGTAPDRPRAYTSHFMLWGLLHGTPTMDHDVRMNFFPGEYETEPVNTVTTQPSDWKIRIRGLGKNPEDVVLKLKADVKGGASDTGGNWVNVIDLGRNSEYLQRFELENITIDGNWTGQTNYNHPGYLRGYKNCPVYASARTGRIRRVIVRNYGAHGVMPQRPNDLGEGVEVFPLHIFTKDEGQQPEDGDPAPWVIEDCEIADFHGYYNGYATCMMAVVRLNVPTTPRWALENTANRLVWFRRNQVRGVPAEPGVITLGAAGVETNRTGKITWSDNVLLNSTVFNTDTGSLRHLDITNCLGLDVYAVGKVGTANARVPSMMDYSVSDNSFRFGWTLTWPDYHNYIVTNKPGGSFGVSVDPSLRLGRHQRLMFGGLKIQGIAQDVRYTGNWFTSRSREDFGNVNPLLPRDPVFRIVHRFPEREPEATNAPRIFRADALDVDLGDNRISSVPFDFERMKPVEGRRLGKLSEGSSPLLDTREALPAQPGFVPMGNLQRVAMVFTNVSRRIPWKGLPFGVKSDQPREGVFDGKDEVLIGAIEVICGQPATVSADGTFRLPVRVALQPTPQAKRSGTTPIPGRTVFLEVLPGSRHPRRLSAEADRNGVATFSYPVEAGANGVDYFRVWTDAGNGRSGEWDEYQDSWSTAYHAHGQTVGVRAYIDVANAQSGDAGELRLRRTGPDDAPLKVKLVLAGGDAAPRLGSAFRLKGPGRKGIPGGRDEAPSEIQDSVEFARGQRELTVQVEAIPGQARSGDLVKLRIESGNGYSTGEPPEGTIVLYAPSK